MPANLPPQYFEAEQRYREARTAPEKLEALKQMLAIMPKHKGTEKLQAELKRKIAKVKEEAHRGRKGGSRGYTTYVEKEGAGQVTLAGLPNTGKSRLVATLTHASPEVADYPFTTRRPQPGMMPFENVQIQLVDLPPLSREYMEPWVTGIIRVSDAILLAVNLGSEEVLEELEEALAILKEHKIKPVPREVERNPYASVAEKRTLVVGTHLDVPGAKENAEVLTELLAGRFPFVSVSLETGEGVETLRRALFDLLELVRVYSKPPGKEPDLTRPFVFRRGATLEDFAASVHKDFVERLRFARVWGPHKFEGQRVNREYVLEDGDVIELHL